MSDSENSEEYYENEDFDMTGGQPVISPFGGLHGRVFKSPQEFFAHSARDMNFDFSNIAHHCSTLYALCSALAIGASMSFSHLSS